MTRPHDWLPGFGPGAVKSRGITVIEPDAERRWSRCARCGSYMSVAALGPLPARVDLPSVGPFAPPKREITRWETEEEGMARCGVDPDCDVAIAAGVHDS